MGNGKGRYNGHLSGKVKSCRSSIRAYKEDHCYAAAVKLIGGASRDPEFRRARVRRASDESLTRARTECEEGVQNASANNREWV